MISTHTPLAGRDNNAVAAYADGEISTHTPLAGRDLPRTGVYLYQGYFYSHAPRGARRRPPLLDPADADFYSHAPRGARLKFLLRQDGSRIFLLTRPSRGATGLSHVSLPVSSFLLTRPSRGATVFGLFLFLGRLISTHTPLAGRDDYILYL